MNDPRGFPGFSIGRRRLLTYAVSAPVVTIAAGFGVNLATPSTALASPTLLIPADSVDYYDVGDSIVQFAAPTMPLVKLSVGTDGMVTLEMPRLENGQGIATALGMMIAEEMDVPLSDVIVHSADAQPELRYNQITGGSSSIRCFDPVLPVMAAAARARLVAYAAQQWGLSPSSLRVEAGVVIAPDGRSATYGSLTVGAGARRRRGRAVRPGRGRGPPARHPRGRRPQQGAEQRAALRRPRGRDPAARRAAVGRADDRRRVRVPAGDGLPAGSGMRDCRRARRPRRDLGRHADPDRGAAGHRCRPRAAGGLGPGSRHPERWRLRPQEIGRAHV